MEVKGDSLEFLITGFLSRDLKQNFRFYLTKNDTEDSWNGVGVLLIRKGIPSSDYDKIGDEL